MQPRSRIGIVFVIALLLFCSVVAATDVCNPISNIGEMNQTINLTPGPMNTTCCVNSSFYLRDTSLSITGTDIERNGVKSWIALMGGTFAGNGGDITVFGNESTWFPGGVSVNVSGANGITPKTAFYVEGLTDTPELNMNKNKIVDMENPAAASDAATKYYHDHNIINSTYLTAVDLTGYYLRDTSRTLTGANIYRDVNNSLISIYGGNTTGSASGAVLAIMGNSYAPSPGSIYAYVSDAAGDGYASMFHMLGMTDTPTLYMENNNITNIVTRQNTDVVNKSYVDAATAPGSAINESYAYLPGRPGGQTLAGGTGANEQLVLYGTFSTTNTTSSVVVVPEGGRFGIGNAAPQYLIDVYKLGATTLHMVADSGVVLYNLKSFQDTASTSGSIQFEEYRGNTSVPAVVQNGDRLGTIRWMGYSATAMNAVAGAQVRVEVDGIPDSGGDTTDMPARLMFLTTPNGFGVPIERVRISENGNISIATTQGKSTLQVNGTLMFPSFPSCTLSTDANGVVYCVSDEKMKDNIVPYTSGLSNILKVNPITYNFKTGSGLDTTQKHSDFSAQNLKDAIPESVYEKGNTYSVFTTDPKTEETIETIYPVLDKDGKQTTKLYVDVKPIISSLINAVKEQQLIIEAQQEQIDNLETRITNLEKKVGI